MTLMVRFQEYDTEYPGYEYEYDTSILDMTLMVRFQEYDTDGEVPGMLEF